MKSLDSEILKMFWEQLSGSEVLTHAKHAVLGWSVCLDKDSQQY